MRRRALAPMFAAKTVLDFSPAVLKAVTALCERWHRKCDEREFDVAVESARLTFGVLECIAGPIRPSLYYYGGHRV
jgi:cytochrome P450